MPGAIHACLAADHHRLGEALTRALVDERIDEESFDTFRRGLLRHIGMEEKVLIPAARRAGGDEALAYVERLRKDHSLLVALLVPSPSAQGIRRLREILSEHDVIEEQPGGLYELCEERLGDEVPAIVEKLRAYPEVPVRPYFDARRSRMLQEDERRKP